MKRVLPILTALLLAATTTVAATPAAEAAPPVEYFVDEAKLPFDALPGIDTERSWGVLKGAGYRIEVPADWNGRLVIWAHGYRGTGAELTVDNHPLRQFLVATGYAWAASSYSRNGFDTAAGVKDTFALTKFFESRYGVPVHTYVTGANIGGLVTAVSAEQWPGTYDGAMSLCGVLSDSEVFDYHLDFNVAAQTLSGVGRTAPFGPDYLTATVPATRAALGPAFPFLTNAQGQAFAALMQQRSGGTRPLFEQGWLFWNAIVPGDFLFGLGAGDGTLDGRRGVVWQNSDVTYQFDGDPALSAAEVQFNDSVQRITADPRARRPDGLANVTPTTGKLRIPMLTLHTLGDLFVPFKMEQDYAERVAAKGDPDLLVQRATRDVGHCTFSPAELVRGFTDLVTWVETGVRPAGDDVLDPAVVAAPDFGCTFTDRTYPRPWNQPAWVFAKPAACPPV